MEQYVKVILFDLFDSRLKLKLGGGKVIISLEDNVTVRVFLNFFKGANVRWKKRPNIRIV